MSETAKNGGLFSKLFRGKNRASSRSRDRNKMMSGRKETWPVPYLSKMEGNATMQPGQSVIFRGFVKGPDRYRFDLNLAGGPEMEGDNRSDIILHISCRLDEKKVVLNTFSNKEWGKEERFKSPFKAGEEFDVRVRAHSDNFEIFLNHKELTKFEHRLPMTSISHIFVNGQVELYAASWEGKYYAMPYEAGIPGNFYPGRKLFVSGEPENGAKKFEINLHSGKDIALHFNPRFNEKAIVRNTSIDGKWGEEERDGEFPLNKKRSFDITIVCEEEGFHCFLDGEEVCMYKHRIPPNNIHGLTVNGDVELQGVHFK